MNEIRINRNRSAPGFCNLFGSMLLPVTSSQLRVSANSVNVTVQVATLRIVFGPFGFDADILQSVPSQTFMKADLKRPSG